MSNSESSNKWRGRIYAYAPLFLWIGVIFFLSSTQGAMTQTSRFIRPFLEWLLPTALPETITLIHNYIRKFAHFAEYAALAFWAWRAFRASSNQFLQKYWHAASFALVVLIASLDEFNQSLNAARTGSVYDILLDISGGFAAIIIILLVGVWKKRA